jgi:zinc D-Ala-D-Ala carboxypeptidase
MPTQLSAHFNSTEFEKDSPIPAECIPIFTQLAQDILEPVRAEFDKPIIITSGYRSQAANAEAHGQPNSEHMAFPWVCACDFVVEGIGQRLVFDWCRQNAALPYHQLILEADGKGGSILHVSINKKLPGVRSVLIGATHNMSPYQKVDFVAYQPPTPQLGADESTQV